MDVSIEMAKTTAKTSATATRPRRRTKAVDSADAVTAAAGDEATTPTAGTARGHGKHLVIVESPAKAKTINKYLGNDYVVRASLGHVRDLPSKGMGVDLDTFEPEYEVIDKK